MAIRYYAKRPMTLDDGRRVGPGDEVPEVASYRNLRQLICFDAIREERTGDDWQDEPHLLPLPRYAKPDEAAWVDPQHVPFAPEPAEPKVVMRHIVGPGVVEDLTTGERRPYEATMTIDLDTAPPEVVEHVKANPKLYKPAPQAKRGKRK